MEGVHPRTYFETRFGITLRPATSTEWHGPCPWCGGHDRFIVWERGTYMCRPGDGHCGRQGWVDELDGRHAPPTAEQRMRWAMQRAAREKADQEKGQRALAELRRSDPHLAYHRNVLNGQGLDYWLSEGMTMESIRTYRLGYCPSCPTYQASPSYTIPVIYRAQLWNIRHRLANPPASGGKYRPHVAGLPSIMFNADDLLDASSEFILLLEGEKKSIVVSQETGLPNVAIMGSKGFLHQWVPMFNRFKVIYIVLDPDVEDDAKDIAGQLGGRAKIVHLPAKPDDFFVRLHGTADKFKAYLED